MSVDSLVAFVGGINIRDGNLRQSSEKYDTQDIHFEVRGPVIDQLNQVLEQDWEFASGEALSLPAWLVPANEQLNEQLNEEPKTICRAIVDGPDDNYHKLELSFIAAINSAKHTIRILTPYFLPNVKIRTSIQLAILRGVRVELITPKHNNLRLVGWAMSANENKLLELGVGLFQSPKPFDHSKLFIVDDDWVLLGSSNWDARSLELNFEVGMECYGEEFAALAIQKFNTKRDAAVAITEKNKTSFLVNIRNNFFRLFSPYL